MEKFMATAKKGASAPVRYGFVTESAFSLPPLDATEEFRDELIEGLFLKPSVCMIFGASNSGKTFLAIDIAMSAAVGVEMLSKRVEKTSVLYIACEAPGGVKTRMRVWTDGNKHRLDGKVGVCDVCANPIDLFGGDDIEEIIMTARLMNAKNTVGNDRADVGLIIIDTLARASGSARENSDDMQKVMNACTRLAEELQCAVLVNHHSGKNKDAGARGHTSVPAHCDTVIEVSESNKIHVAFIQKQRDLPTKGEEFAYRLVSRDIGTNQWGTMRTSCFIEKTDVPQLVNGLSVNDRKVIRALEAASGTSLTRAEIADAAGLDKSNSDKRVRHLLKQEILRESAIGAKIFINPDASEVG